MKMKNLFVTLSAFFAFTAAAFAQEDIEQLQQEPPRTTQAQVERSAASDAKNATSDNAAKKTETIKKDAVKQRSKNIKDNSNDTITKKKASTRSGKR